jgi:hypothetical protein
MTDKNLKLHPSILNHSKKAFIDLSKRCIKFLKLNIVLNIFQLFFKSYETSLS